MKWKLAIMPLLLIATALTCSCQPVQAWERGTLARPEIAIESDALESALNNHIYFSKEASNGGHSATGGGCGCN